VGFLTYSSKIFRKGIMNFPTQENISEFITNSLNNMKNLILNNKRLLFLAGIAIYLLFKEPKE